MNGFPVARYDGLLQTYWGNFLSAKTLEYQRAGWRMFDIRIRSHLQAPNNLYRPFPARRPDPPTPYAPELAGNPPALSAAQIPSIASIRSARVGSLAIPPNSLRGIFPDRRRILPRACGGSSHRCRPQDVVFYALVGEVRFHIFGSGDAAEVERFPQHLPCPIRCRGARWNVRRVLELRVCCAHWTIENTPFPSGRQNSVNFLPSTAER